MYHYSATLFLLGIRMIWIPEMSSLQEQNDSIKNDASSRGHKSQFKVMMKMCVNDEITMMDQVNIENERP